MHSRFFKGSHHIATMLRNNVGCLAKLPQNPTRLKSSVSVEIHFTETFESNITAIMQDLKVSRTRVDSMLEKNLQEGIKHQKKHDLREAMTYFEKVISFKAQDHIDNLSINERKLVALALTHAADIERIGTEADENKALVYLDQALELSPNLNEAQELKNALLSDRVRPRF